MLRQPRSGHALRKAGIVVDALCHTGLASDGATRDDEGIPALPGAIYGRGQPRRPRPHDDDSVELPRGARLDAQLRRKLGICRLDQDGAVLEQDGRNDLLSVVDLLNVLQAVRVVVDVYPLIVDHLVSEELLRPRAIWTPGGVCTL